MTIHLLRPSLLVRNRLMGTVSTLRSSIIPSASSSSSLAATVRCGRSSAVTTATSTTTTMMFLRRFGSTPIRSRCNSIYNRYHDLLRKRPFLVQALQAGTLMGLGDFIAQTCLENRVAVQDVDYNRTFRFFALGLLFVGPTVRFWYGLLDRGLVHRNPVVRTLQKVVVDQLVFAPVFMAQLVAIISYMQHQSVARLEEKLRREYLDILVANYYVWPWVQLVNFRFVPLNYQVPLTQLVAVLWNIYISWKTNQDV